MSYLLTDGCDLKGGRKEVVCQMEHEAFVCVPTTASNRASGDVDMNRHG